MVHSLGVAQPNPDVFIRLWDTPKADVCVHALVSQDGVTQLLPWEHRAWHAGVGTSGVSANNTHISFEICEPSGHTYEGGTMVGYDAEKNAAYFAGVYQRAVALTAMLCTKYHLDPLSDVLCHSEGYQRGIASNHSDVMQWFPKHGKSMDTFRAEVKALMGGKEEDEMTQQEFTAMFAKAMETYTQSVNSKHADTWAQEAWDKAKAQGVFDGTMPQAPLTREQGALILERLGLLK
ncbi:MAG: N-acetylmuramoyl-L-alanine amidase [Clostridia bacterium]|nr:N-acetylmuramoyl-L-alanine amidase [Clostridia bacterium]